MVKNLTAVQTPQHIIEDFVDMWPYVKNFGCASLFAAPFAASRD